MLVLIAGVTGNIGQYLISSLVKRGHQVRGLGRNPDKLPAHLRDQLEDFIVSATYYDVPALDKACNGVNAVVSAYNGMPELLVEGQLLLFRAAERANVQHFIPASFSYDWRKLHLTQHDSYDPMIMFDNQIQLTSSSLSPTYVFTGVLAEVLFGTPGHEYFTTANHGPWNPVEKKMEVWGDEKRVWHWTSESDVAEFVAGILSLSSDRLKAQQFWNVASGVGTLTEIAKTYGEIRKRRVEVVNLGTVEELKEKAFEAKSRGSRNMFWGYIGWFYNLWTVDGTWCLGELDNEKIGVMGEGLQAFLERFPEA